MENNDDYKHRLEQEGEAYLADLKTLPADTKRKLIKEASEYRSSEDRCNSVYMGSMAHGMLRVALGGTSMEIGRAHV